MTGGNNQASFFHINDQGNQGGNEAETGHMLTFHQTDKNSTTWRINGASDKTVTMANNTWYTFQLSKKGSMLYLTVTPTAGGDPVFAQQQIPVTSEKGGLGNMIFQTKRYYAFMAIDNVVLRAWQDGDTPAGVITTYTVKYQNEGGEQIANDVEGSGFVGDEVTASAAQTNPLMYNDKKYIYKSGNEKKTLVETAASNVITLVYRETATYAYSVTSSLGETLASGSGFEGETVHVGYSHYQLSEGKLYEAAVTDKEFRKKLVLSENNVSATVDYAEWNGSNPVVFCAEGESINGMTESVSGNFPIRASNAKAGVASEDVTITTLPAGKYVLHVGTFTSTSKEKKIYIGYGETQYAFASSSNLSESASDEFTLAEETAIKYFGTASSADAQFDYIYIEKTGEYVPVVTSYAVTISDEIENGTVVADPTSANAGAEVTLTNTPAEGYEFVSYSVTCKTNNEAVIVTDGKFTMPADDVTVSATFQLPAPATYAVTISDEIENGTVAVNPTTAKAGEEVTITATPAEGYELVSVSVTGVTSNEAVIVTDGKFTMPADAVTVNAKFQQKATPTIYIETDLTEKFSALTDWHNWKGATGYTATNFCPEVTTNAGKKVQVCEKYEGTCTSKGEIFTQTVTGLTPGTYKIELYGGAAFTFGRGFGSMAFTGDLSKATSDTYQAGDRIEPTGAVSTGVSLTATTSEGVYGGEIPIYYATNFPDGAAVVTLNDVAIGENGTITIGMNKEGEDTNWHVIQLKGVTAQVPAADVLADAVEAAKSIAESEVLAVLYSRLQQTIADYNKEYSTAEEYLNAISAINNVVDIAKGYIPLSAVLNEGEGYKANIPAEDPAIAAYDAAIADVKAAYDATAVADIPASVKVVEAALPALAKAQTAPGSDMTRAIVNNGFEDGNLNGWENLGTAPAQVQNNASFELKSGNWYAEAWHKSGVINLAQTITGLPAGKYTLKADISSQAADAVLYANKAETSIDANASGTFEVEGIIVSPSDGNEMTICFKWTDESKYWNCMDNFRLVLVEAIETYSIEYALGMQNGTVTGPTAAVEGEKVTLKVTPAEGYELETLTIKCEESQNEINYDVVDYSFTMPKEGVYIIATFVQTTGIDAASAAKGKKIGVKKYFKNGELIIIGKDGKEFRANGAAK